MAFNEEVRFEWADSTVRRAFLLAPERVLLPARLRLYKWTDRPLVNGDRVSPWWSLVENHVLPSGELAEGLRVTQERAARLGKSQRDYSRVRAAVSGEFKNSMANRLVISLNEASWAFIGRAAGQPEFAAKETDLRNVLLIGGAHQVWLPNLTEKQVSVVTTN